MASLCAFAGALDMSALRNQTYPEKPTHLVYAESADLKTWSPPKPFLKEAMDLPAGEVEGRMESAPANASSVSGFHLDKTVNTAVVFSL